MEQTKENLINSLVIDLAETSNLPINDLKSKIETKLYNWNCTEITDTELSVCDGSVTRELLKYFRIGKLGSNKTIETIEQYERAALQLCDMVNKERESLEMTKIFSAAKEHNMSFEQVIELISKVH